jgi:hypothetical protein
MRAELAERLLNLAGRTSLSRRLFFRLDSCLDRGFGLGTGLTSSIGSLLEALLASCQRAEPRALATDDAKRGVVGRDGRGGWRHATGEDAVRLAEHRH